jgi:hypothetical protein
MGLLPTVAYLRFWHTGFWGLIDRIAADIASPTQRATELVEQISGSWGIGKKLASFFVSSICTPSLYPEFAVLFPDFDGNQTLVIDTHVRRSVGKLSHNRAVTLEQQERWLLKTARGFRLTDFHPKVPSYSPRLIQQALYSYSSRSNRVARGDPCASRRCDRCVKIVCPFS